MLGHAGGVWFEDVIDLFIFLLEFI
jgi:hypothetical protein